MKIYVRHRHGQMARDGDLSHKIDYVNNCLDIVKLKGHQNHNIDSKATAILLKWGIWTIYGVASEGSAPVACAAGWFLISKRLKEIQKV